MKLSISKASLPSYLIQQLRAFFPDTRTKDKEPLQRHMDYILQRTEYCFSRINNLYFNDDEGVIFNHLHADQYAMFLYFAANTLYQQECDLTLSTKVFQLNRYLHSIDAYYEVELPDIFLFVHPLGTVFGRGKYSNYFLVYQRCSIGSNKDVYPTLGEYVSMHPGSSILGNCIVGDNCKIAAGSLLLDRDLKSNSLYIGYPRSFKIKDIDLRPNIWK